MIYALDRQEEIQMRAEKAKRDPKYDKDYQ